MGTAVSGKDRAPALQERKQSAVGGSGSGRGNGLP